jgi:HK97 gp10 family phage protein
MGNGFKIEGLDETRKALEELGPKAEKRVIRQGLRIGAKVVLEAARGEAPERSGVLKRNIKIRSGRGSKGKIVLTVGVADKDFKGPTFYAGFVLFGSFVGSRQLGDKRHFRPANNFLQRAFDETKEQAVAATTEAWKDLIDEIANQ